MGNVLMSDFDPTQVKKVVTVTARSVNGYLEKGWTLLGIEKEVRPSGFGATLNETVTLVLGWARAGNPPAR